MVRTVLLDLGNVLLFHDNALLFRRLAERAGREGEAEALGRGLVEHPLWTRANRGELDGDALRRAVCGLLGTDIPTDEFFDLWSCHFTPHPAVYPLVEALVGKVSLHLVSNTNPLHVAWFRPRLPLLGRFDSLVLSCEVGAVKPEPRIWELALERAACRPEEAAFFDDAAPFVDAARALGLQAFLFTDAATFARDLASLGLR